jgi:hypothetical protein
MASITTVKRIGERMQHPQVMPEQKKFWHHLWKGKLLVFL